MVSNDESDSSCEEGYAGHLSSFETWLRSLQRVFGSQLLLLLCAVQHLLKGLAGSLGARATPYLFKAYHVPAQDIQIWKTCIFSPYILKPIIGLVSDLFPVGGYHKGPYMLLGSLGGMAAAAGIGAARLPLHLFIFGLFLFELMICTDDLLTEALYAREMQDHPKHGQNLLTFVFAGMSLCSLLGNLSSGFLLTSLGAHGVFLFAALCSVPAVLAASGFPEVQQGPEAIHAKRAEFWRQKEACALALVVLCASLSMSLVAICTKDPAANAGTAALAALAVGVSFSVVLSPVIAKFSVFTLLQTSLHLSASAPAFYFLTDSEEEFPDGPHFSKLFYNTCLGCVGGVFTLLGLYTYNRYSSTLSYRKVIVVSNTAFSLLHMTDMVLFSRLNLRLGIPDYVFAFGNQSLGTLVYQWLWMPQVALLSQLCPKGMEATMFALVVSCHNLGVAVSSSWGSLLLERLSCNPTGAKAESEESFGTFGWPRPSPVCCRCWASGRSFGWSPRLPRANRSCRWATARQAHCGSAGACQSTRRC
ncbi:unnamed protein product [Effrenium voratum]|uniref:Uncharacterized protein n=1 Tax=Effrenium voratum TaxID=2562239 RepID=A0AA36IVG9_9DINO|nr:unnamed protein product [Effrenium voratum]